MSDASEQKKLFADAKLALPAPAHKAAPPPEQTVNPLKSYEELPTEDGKKIPAGTLLRLDAKKKRKAALIQNFGGYPTSIWKVVHSENKNVEDMVGQTQEAVWNDLFGNIYDKNFYRNYAGVGKTVRRKVMVNGKQMGTFSLFPYDVARKLLILYSLKGDVVLDPFAGHATRLTACFKLGRNYIGYDVSAFIMEHNQKLVEKLHNNSLTPSTATTTLKMKSCELMDEKSDSVDFIFSSPPYWDIEYYGAEKDQLGKEGLSYKAFLLAMRRVMTQCARVLKPTHYLAFVVSDFHKENHFYIYHADLIKLARQIGLNVHDIIILDKGSVSVGFSTLLFEFRRTAKVHEYALIFRKPKNCTIHWHASAYRPHETLCEHCGGVVKWHQLDDTHEEGECQNCKTKPARTIRY